MRGRVAITGASGFLGQAGCVDLIARGFVVRAVTRSVAAIPGTDVHRVSDLTDPVQVADAFRNCDVVIHLAGIAHRRMKPGGRDAEELARVNVQATRNVCREAATTGVSTIILMSSAAAAGVSGAAADGDATDVPRVDTAYARSKLDAERVAREAVAKSATRLLIFRPPMVYGPGMKGNPLRLFRLVDAGIPLPLGGIRNRRSTLFVGNLFAAIAATLASERQSDDALYPTDGPPLSTPEFIRKVARALGKPPRLFAVPLTGLRALARMADLVSTVGPPLPGTDELERLTESFVVDDRGVRAAFSYRPPHEIDSGLALTAAWWRVRS
jgi:nucleoside-diphosphate-sugar epimerase